MAAVRRHPVVFTSKEEDPFQHGRRCNLSLIFSRLLQTWCWWEKTNTVLCKSTQFTCYLHSSDYYLFFFFFFQKYILFHKAQEHRVSTGLIALYATHQNQTSTVISSGSATFYMPASLIQLLFVHNSRETESRLHRPCVLGMLTELTHSPYAWARYPGRVRMTWHDDTWWWNSKGIALIFLCWFPAEWTCGRPKSVRMQHEEKDPCSLPHSANKHRAAATTKKRTSLSPLLLQQVDSICSQSLWR